MAYSRKRSYDDDSVSTTDDSSSYRSTSSGSSEYGQRKLKYRRRSRSPPHRRRSRSPPHRRRSRSPPHRRRFRSPPHHRRCRSPTYRQRSRSSKNDRECWTSSYNRKRSRSPSYGRKESLSHGRRTRSPPYSRQSKSPRYVRRRHYVDISPYRKKQQFERLRMPTAGSSIFSELLRTKSKREMGGEWTEDTEDQAEAVNHRNEKVWREKLTKGMTHSVQSDSEEDIDSSSLLSAEKVVNILSKNISEPVEKQPPKIHIGEELQLQQKKPHLVSIDRKNIAEPVSEPVKKQPLGIHIGEEIIFQQTKPQLVNISSKDITEPVSEPVKKQPLELQIGEGIHLQQRKPVQVAIQWPTVMNLCRHGSLVSTSTRCLDEFQIIDLVGEGSYGEVYKAKDKKTNELVALKKIKNFNKKEFSIIVLREIKILNELNHRNIVDLKGVVSDRSNAEGFKKDGSIYFVLEYMDHDLKGLLESTMVVFSELHIASTMKQLLGGIQYCHERNILHRDIKTSNILINNRGQVKLADFGLAKQQDPQEKWRLQTNKVVTYWYRPPELLLGERRYGTAIDIWSCGCVLGELFQKKPMFPGKDDLNQLYLISRVCGSATPDVWDSVITLPHFGMLNPKSIYRRILRNIFSFIPPLALDILDKMLMLDPEKRITVEGALNSPWLKNIDPERITPPELPEHLNCNEQMSRKQKILG